jgi:hypothetical protein
MQNKNNNQKGTMTKIRMNTELRNKLFNKIKNVFENEDTQEKEAFLQAREQVDYEYNIAHNLAQEVVERAYPPEDVSVLRTFKKNMELLVMLLQKINAFTLHTMKMLMMRAKQKKLNHILILVCLEI